ncbi:MAG: hypothetical protein NTU60_00415 [Candidatus Aminicenantes bacterium]|nr:hypothetical protein [Candidatus Aminicenantes bacterium]
MKNREKEKIPGPEPDPGGAVSRRRISDRETRSLIQAAIEKTGRISPLPASLEPAGWKRGRAGLIRSLPAWVGRFGFLAGLNEFGLWCEPLPGPREAFPSQLVIDVPPGRYMIESLDAETSTWVSRESAEGGPLVAGLPCTGNPVFVWIRLKS